MCFLTYANALMLTDDACEAVPCRDQYNNQVSVLLNFGACSCSLTVAFR